MYVLLERRSNFTAGLHVYVSRKARGRQAVRFIEEVHVYLKAVDIDLRYTFNYTKDSKAMLFMGCFDSARFIGKFKGYSVYRGKV